MFYSGIADEAGGPIEAQVRAHKELGWGHIEIRSVEKVNLTDLCDETFDEVARKVDAAGLHVSCFASQLCNWSRPITKHPDIDRHELERAIPRMERLGCRFIRTMSYTSGGWPEQKWRDEAVERLKVLAGMAERGEVLLLHENCDGWGSQGPEQTLELLRRVNSPSLKLLWDTGNSGPHGLDSWGYYETVRDHVAYVHIKDAGTRDGKMAFTFPGEGDGRVGEIIADLLGRGYDGGLSIEPHMEVVVHEGKDASKADAAYRVYVEYGRRLVRLVEQVQSGAVMTE